MDDLLFVLSIRVLCVVNFMCQRVKHKHPTFFAKFEVPLIIISMIIVIIIISIIIIIIIIIIITTTMMMMMMIIIIIIIIHCSRRVRPAQLRGVRVIQL